MIILNPGDPRGENELWQQRSAELKMRTDQMENTEENYNKGATNGKDATDE